MPKRIMQGIVVSDKGNQTVIVRIDRSFSHPLLRKTVRKSKRYAAHDVENKYKVGDMVKIQECRPISKTKRWEVLSASV